MELQALMSTGMLRPKLQIGAPDDPLEREADRMAHSVMSSGAPCSCSAGSPPCASCQTSMVNGALKRKAESGRQPHVAGEALGLGSGKRLDDSSRSFFESRMGADFSGVRIHDDATAARSATQLNARAFTIGSDIAFGKGNYRPHSNDGRELIAHELTHVLQGTAAIRRAPLDPKNTAAWDWYGSEDHRKQFGFLDTVTAAGGSAKDMQTALATTGVPSTDEQKAAFEERALTLIRLNAVTMVGKHRAELAERQKLFEDMAADPKPGTAVAGEGAAGSRRADMLQAVRTASQVVLQLRERKEQLTSLRDTIGRAVRFNAGAEAMEDEYKTLSDSAQQDSTPETMRQVLWTREQIHRGDLAWGSKKLKLMNLADDLGKLRRAQMLGIDVSMTMTYNSFPFLADLSSQWIQSGKTEKPGAVAKVQAFSLGIASLTLPALMPYAAKLSHDIFKKDAPPDDASLQAAVRSSFEKLLTNTDEAIVKVGSGGIHPLDLPGAVAATRIALPESLRPELDRLKQEREVLHFTEDMIMALGIAVLTGLTGGLAGIGLAAYAAGTGAVAAGVGVAQVGGQIKDAFDRQTLASASTSPDGSLLGVSAPSLFEWTMIGVSAVLAAADLAAVAKEISALRPAFHESPHAPTGHSAPAIASSESADSSVVPKTAEIAPETGALSPKAITPENPAEARVIQAGKGDVVPSLEQVDSELAIVEQSKPTKIPGKEFKEEVELPNGHTWRHSAEDMWCRFSKGRICVPGTRGKKAVTKASSLEDLEKLERAGGPDISKPPASVVTNDDLTMWELYNNYYYGRLADTRLDFETVRATKRNLPKTYAEFVSTWKDSPALPMLKGRVAQGRMGKVIEGVISEGKVGQNIAISTGPAPAPNEIVRPDFMWAGGGDNFTAVSNKSRDFANMTEAELKKIVGQDVDEALAKYYGKKWVRTPGTQVSEKQIIIDEVKLNYDPTKASEETMARVNAYAMEHAAGRGRIEVTNFQMDSFENFVP